MAYNYTLFMLWLNKLNFKKNLINLSFLSIGIFFLVMIIKIYTDREDYQYTMAQITIIFSLVATTYFIIFLKKNWKRIMYIFFSLLFFYFTIQILYYTIIERVLSYNEIIQIILYYKYNWWLFLFPIFILGVLLNRKEEKKDEPYEPIDEPIDEPIAKIIYEIKNEAIFVSTEEKRHISDIYFKEFINMFVTDTKSIVDIQDKVKATKKTLTKEISKLALNLMYDHNSENSKRYNTPENEIIIRLLSLLKTGFLNESKSYLLNKEEKRIITEEIAILIQIELYITNSNLFDERKKDLRKILLLLEKTNTLGIDSKWGTGKTKLITETSECLKIKGNHIINLNLLNINEEDLLPRLLKELSILLRQHNIYCGHENKILKVISESIDTKFNFKVSSIIESFYTVEIEKYLESFKLITGDIYIIFDDFDRILDEKKIQKILYFIGEFCKKQIKSIVLYTQEELEKKHEHFNRYYIEKFIPRNYSISNLSFKNLIILFRKELKLHSIKESDFENLLKFITRENIDNNSVFKDWEDIKAGLDITPRKVQRMLLEIHSLQDLSLFHRNFGLPRQGENKAKIELIIPFVFLKLFFHEEFYTKRENFINLETTFPTAESEYELLCNHQKESIFPIIRKDAKELDNFFNGYFKIEIIEKKAFFFHNDKKKSSIIFNQEKNETNIADFTSINYRVTIDINKDLTYSIRGRETYLIRENSKNPKDNNINYQIKELFFSTGTKDTALIDFSIKEFFKNGSINRENI